MISVSIVEDHAGTRSSLKQLLEDAPGFRLLNTYGSGEEALTGMAGATPDVALIDINLPGMSGIDCVRKLKSRSPVMKILMLTTYEESDLIFNSLRAGASGYLLKKMATVELLPAIEQVHAGGAPMTMQIARKVVEHFHQVSGANNVEKLTPREQETIALLAQGLLYKEIADKLGVTVHTVKRHLHAIYEKLHVQSRTQATAKYLKGSN
jgi:DNA-binding NarL/FixJ family response regulator